MKFIIAIDSFKGCLSSKEANDAAAEGIRRAYPDAEIIKVPVRMDYERLHRINTTVYAQQTGENPLVHTVVPEA